MSKICVTGGAGFIGSYVIRRLLEEGHEVIMYDSFLHYVYPIQRQHHYNIDARMEGLYERCTVVRGSTQDVDFLTRSLREHKPTRIIHLAARPLAKMAIEHPEEALNAIVNGTMNLLQAARNIDGFERFVYVSSSMVYGNFKQIPAPESHPKDPMEVYGGLKLSGEVLTRVYTRLYDIDHTIVRPSAVYGPTDNNRRVIGIFLENALHGKKLVVNGPETPLDFTYVKDIAEGIILATLKPEAKNDTFNVTCGRSRTILEAARIIQELIPGTEIEVKEHEKNMPLRGALDTAHVCEKLGYQPQYQLEDGLREYLDYLRIQQAAGAL